MLVQGEANAHLFNDTLGLGTGARVELQSKYLINEKV